MAPKIKKDQNKKIKVKPFTPKEKDFLEVLMDHHMTEKFEYMRVWWEEHQDDRK